MLTGSGTCADHRGAGAESLTWDGKHLDLQDLAARTENGGGEESRTYGISLWRGMEEGRMLSDRQALKYPPGNGVTLILL